MSMTDSESKKKPLTPEKALQRIRKYCAYQERSQQEVRNRLYSWGLKSHDLESIIADLISDGFLKEERFASAFTGGKFRQKKWGKIRIRQALLEKKVSEPLIRKALSEIEETEYIKTLKLLLRLREEKIREKNVYKRKHLIASYAIQRGFEPELVWSLMND